MPSETLQILWFVLIAILWIGFSFLEGFDFGMGMLLPFLGKTDDERRLIINSVGPHWDGNEVWLVTAGGATFAAFPQWYATMLSGFYPVVLLLLLGLILRGVAFEFRSKDAHPRWRALWDWSIFAGSLVPSLVLGALLANLAVGVPIDASGSFAGSRLTLPNPVALLGAAAVVAAFLLHGANFLSLKLSDSLRERAGKAAGRLWPAAVALVGAQMIAICASTDLFVGHGVASVLAPAGAVAGLLLAGYCLRRRREGWTFVVTGISIVLMQATYFLVMFPRVMVSSLGPDLSLTIYNASSSPYTLKLMTIVAAIFLPIVLIYQGWSYYVFRERLRSGSQLEY